MVFELHTEIYETWYDHKIDQNDYEWREIGRDSLL